MRPAAPLRLAPRAQAGSGQPSGAEEWQQRYEQLADFVKQHSRLPRKCGSQPMLAEERELAQWCSTGQAVRRGAPLRPAPRAQAESSQSVHDEQWEQQRQQVTAFVERHGRLPRPAGGQREPLLAGEQQLGKWGSAQRLRRKGKQQPPL